jgi:hypothetical protein
MTAVRGALLVGAVACGPDISQPTVVDELTVLGLSARPPEVGPGDLLQLDVRVVDPDRVGFDLLVWLCTSDDYRCLEAGPDPRPLDGWTRVIRGASPQETVLFPVPASFELLLPEPAVTVGFVVWALACAPGRCPIVDAVAAAPEAGSEAWSTVVERLSEPTSLIEGTTFEEANLSFRRLVFSTRPPEERNQPPVLLRVGDAPLEVETGGELVLSFTSVDALYLYPYATGGEFQYRFYAMTGGAASLAWLAPELPGRFELFAFATDGLGGEVWWEGVVNVR